MRMTIQATKIILFSAILGLVASCGDSSTPALTPFSVAVIGDMPYGLSPSNNAGVLDDTQFKAIPAFFTNINKDADVSTVMHLGDIHSGSEPCTETFNRSVAAQLATLKFPIVYTPGDNEWSDCHKPKQAIDAPSAQAKDPIFNLDLVRSIFFPTPGKAINGSLDVRSQAVDFDPAFPADKKFVENVWWMKSGVLFVTMNVPGGSNNNNDIWLAASTRTAVQVQEVAERSAANIRWLNSAFKNAKAMGAIGVVVQVQGDMWDLDSKVDATGTIPTLFAGTPNCAAAVGCSHISEYKQFIDSIATNTLSFGKPVLMFNGDSHFYRTDNPLKQGQACAIESITIDTTAKTAKAKADGTTVACSSTTVPTFIAGDADPYKNQPHGYDVPNFRRLVVHGSTLPFEYIKLAIDPNANAANSTTGFGPFSWTRVKP
jgi:Calcineurin-like phosphoesterase